MEASLLSPLQRERSIEVLPGASVSASSELSSALIRERTRSARSLREESNNMTPVNRDRPLTPILKQSSFRMTGRVEHRLESDTPLEENEVMLIQPHSTNSMTLTPAENQKEEVCASDSSEKENGSSKTSKKSKKSKKKARKGLLKLLRPKQSPGKSLPLLGKPPKSPSSKVESSMMPSTPVTTKTISHSVIAMPPRSPRSVTESVDSLSSEITDEVLLERAKEYTRMSTTLLESLKNDGTTDGNLSGSIQRAKLAYEYAIKAKELYSSVSLGNRNRSGSVNSYSVGSSHITEKAGNITKRISTFGSGASSEGRAATPLSSLLLDVKGNEASQELDAALTPTSIEIEHDGKIRFEAPNSCSISMPEPDESEEDGIEYLLEPAGASQGNQDIRPVETLPKAQEESSRRTLSPLSAILGAMEKKPSALESKLDTKKRDLGSMEDVVATDDKKSVPLVDIAEEDETERSQSDIIYPPALNTSHSSSTSSKGSSVIHDDESVFSGNTTPSQELLLWHQENRMDERLKEMTCQRTSLVEAFQCGTGLDHVTTGSNNFHEKPPRSQTSRTGSVRITVIEDVEEAKAEALSNTKEVEPETKAPDGASLILRSRAKEGLSLVRSPAKAAVKEGTVSARSSSRYDTLQSQLREAKALAEEILNGDVNVMQEVNPFICASGDIRLKSTFDDATYKTYDSDESDSLKGPIFTDDEEQTYGTTSDVSFVDTVGTCSISLEDPHEGFEVLEKKATTEWEANFDVEWKATFNEDWQETFDDNAWKASLESTGNDDGSNSESEFPYLSRHREMTVLGNASDFDEDDSSLTSSSSSSISSMSNDSSY